MQNQQILANIRDDVSKLKYATKEQRDDLSFKMTALNHNFNAIYFGVINDNYLHNQIIFAKSLEFNPKIGKNNFYFETRDEIDKICDNDQFLNKEFQKNIENFRKTPQTIYSIKELKNLGKEKNYKELTKLMINKPIEYLNLPSSFKYDRQLIGLCLSNINDFSGYEKDIKGRIVKIKQTIPKEILNVSDLCAYTFANSFLGKMYKEEIQKIYKDKANAKLINKLFSNKPIVALISDCYKKEKLNGLLEFVLSSDLGYNDYILLKDYAMNNDEVKKFFNDVDNFKNFNFAKAPTEFYEIIGENVINDSWFIENSFKNNKNIYPFLNDYCKNSNFYASKFLQVSGNNYLNLPIGLKEDYSLSNLALSKSASMYYYLPEHMKVNVTLAKTALNKDVWSYFLFNENMQKNEEILKNINKIKKSEYFKHSFNLYAKEKNIELKVENNNDKEKEKPKLVKSKTGIGKEKII